MRDTNIARRAACYGIRGQQVDGNDVLAVYEAAAQAVAECRAGSGPVLLELLTYRRTGHSRRDPCHYQPKDEREAWAAKDPTRSVRRGAEGPRQSSTTPAWKRSRRDVVDQFNEAVESPAGPPQPTLADLTTDVFA